MLNKMLRTALSFLGLFQIFPLIFLCYNFIPMVIISELMIIMESIFITLWVYIDQSNELINEAKKQLRYTNPYELLLCVGWKGFYLYNNGVKSKPTWNLKKLITREGYNYNDK